MLFWWMLINLLTALAALATDLLIEVLYKNQNHLKAEGWAFYWVISVSLVDIGLMMYKRPFFQPLGRWVPRDDILEAPDATPTPGDPTPD
jgi:hypothetical protein